MEGLKENPTAAKWMVFWWQGWCCAPQSSLKCPGARQKKPIKPYFYFYRTLPIRKYVLPSPKMGLLTREIVLRGKSPSRWICVSIKVLFHTSMGFAALKIEEKLSFPSLPLKPSQGVYPEWWNHHRVWRSAAGEKYSAVVVESLEEQFAWRIVSPCEVRILCGPPWRMTRTCTLCSRDGKKICLPEGVVQRRACRFSTCPPKSTVDSITASNTSCNETSINRGVNNWYFNIPANYEAFREQ